MVASGKPQLRILLLGGFEVEGQRRSIHLESAKTAAVLARLALAHGPLARSRLTGLLWPDLSEERAAGNLRRALWDLRRNLDREPGGPWLVAGRGDVSLRRGPGLEVDVDRFEAAAATLARPVLPGDPAPVAAALLLYRGELLSGLAVRDAEPFEEWLLAERERLGELALGAFARYVDLCRRRGEIREGLAWGRRLVALDGWREASHRMVMELLALAGEPAAALAQYESCRRLLAEGLQVEPSAATRGLAERLRAASRRPSAGSVVPLPPPHDLPVPTTSFVGREREISELAELVASPEVRLVTLVGPGGIGKSRLALQVAARLLDRPGAPLFPQGLWHLPVSPGSGAGGLAASLCERLGLDPAGAGEAVERLVDFLRARRLLLLLDGAEYRFAEARALAAELTHATAEVQLLATSRRPLALEGEWVVEVGGLDLPGPEGAADPGRSGAVQLFLQAARRACFGFGAGDGELGAIAAICRRLGGSPTGIQLAAGWLRSLPLAALAERLDRDLGLLDQTPGGGEGVLERIFATSWDQLDERSQVALSGLSVFAGTASAADAAAVAGADLRQLALLVDRSLLRREAGGRFSLHEVLRHGARARLRARGGEEAALDRHAERLAAHAAELVTRLGGLQEEAALDEIGAAFDDLCAAWRRAVGAGRAEQLPPLARALSAYGRERGRGAQVEELLGEAVAAPPAGGLPAAVLLARGALRNRLGSYAAARADAVAGLASADGGGEAAAACLLLAESAFFQGEYALARETLARADRSVEVADAAARLVLAGRIELEVGRLEEAREAFRESLGAARAAGNGRAERIALSEIGRAAYFAGDLARAEESLAEALAQGRAAGDRDTQVRALHGLGFVADERGRHDEAVPHYRESLTLAEESGDRRAVAYTRMLIGESARLAGDLDTARRAYEEALGLARRLGSAYLVGLLLGNLAYVAAAEGRVPEARSLAREVLTVHRESGSDTVALPALIALAEVALRAGGGAEGLALLGAVGAHPANRRDHQGEIDRVLAVARRLLPEAEVAAGLAAGRVLSFPELCARLAAGGRPPAG